MIRKSPGSKNIAQLGQADELEKVIRRDDWNDYLIVANGNMFTHIINGRVQTLAIDEDEKNFRRCRESWRCNCTAESQ